MAEDLGWDEAGLIERCAGLRTALEEGGLASSIEIADYWPGGKENQEKAPGDWIYCYAQLSGMVRSRLEDKSAVKAATAEPMVMAALREEPIKVELMARGEDGAPRYLLVYPKSFHAICQIEARDRELARLADAMDLLSDLPASVQAEWGRQLREESEYQNQVMVWILTTSGPDLPYPDSMVRPEVPAEVLALAPQDIVGVLRGHRVVNGLRIAAAADLMGSGRGGKQTRSSWSVLASSGATELGVSATSLLRDWSLGAWVSQLFLTNAARQEAMEAAKKKAPAA